MRPDDATRAGRELVKNLKNNLTTFVPFCREGLDVYMELKPYLNKQQRIERGYSGVTLYQDEATFDETEATNDEAKDFDELMRDVDLERQEWYSLWSFSIYLKPFLDECRHASTVYSPCPPP